MEKNANFVAKIRHYAPSGRDLTSTCMDPKIQAHANILELIGKTPLVRLNSLTADFPGEFYAKLEAFNPGHSAKDRIAHYIIEQAEKQGQLRA